MEVKLTAAKVLVNSTGSVLTSPRLPLGESQCVETPLIQEEHYCVDRKSHIFLYVFVFVRSVHHIVSVEESVYAASG